MRVPETIRLVGVCVMLVPALIAGEPHLPGTIVPIADSASSLPSESVVWDVDGDGILDVVTAVVTTGQKVLTFKGDGFGGFAAVGSASPAASTGVRIAVGDFDADGFFDVVLDATSPTSAVRAMRGDGTGAFAATVSSTLGGIGSIRDFATADFDGDGRDDVVVTGTTGARVGLANGGMTFVATGLTWPAATSAVTHDLDGDARPDIVFTHELANTLSWTFGTGPATFAPLSSASTALGPRRVFPADVDGDGVTDLAILFVGSGSLVSIYRGVGATFSLLKSVSMDPDVTAFAIADLDGNGIGDIVAAQGSEDRVAIRTGHIPGPGGGGSGLGFVGPFFVPTGNYPFDLHLADFDGDARIDFVASCPTGQSLVVARGAGPSAPWFEAPTPDFIPNAAAAGFVAELNGDGSADFASLVTNTPGSLSELHVRRSSGPSGGFLAPLVSPLGVAATQIVGHGDFDGDGRDDALLAVGLQIVLVLNDGTGAFTPVATLPAPPTTGSAVVDAAFGDVDGDLDQDILATYTGAPAPFVVHENLGAFAFAPPVSVPGAFIPANATLAVADVDANGRDDVVVQKLGGGALQLVRNFASGPVVTTFAASTPTRTRFADLDADGLPDLMLQATHSLAVLKNLGGVAFGPAITSFMPTAIFPSLADIESVGDVDADGTPDVAFVDPVRNAVLVARGVSTTTPVTYSLHLAGHSATSVAIAQLDGDAKHEIVTFGPWGSTTPPNQAGLFMILDESCPGQIGTHGAGCVGSGGFVPQLFMQGCATPGGSLTLGVQHALGGSVALLVTGILPANLPIGGSGCSLSTSPLLPFSVVLPLSGVGPGAGAFAASLSIPATTITGTLEIQALIADPTLSTGFTTTNGLTVRVE